MKARVCELWHVSLRGKLSKLVRTASLTSISLAANELDAEAAKALAPAVASSSSLTKLDARRNSLSSEGKAALRDAVRSKKGFKLLI